MANFLDTQHISNHLEDYESARSGFFTFIIDDLDNLTKYTFNPDTGEATEADQYKKAQEYIMLSVTKASVPQAKIDTSSIRRGNEEVHFATTPTWSSGSLLINDYVGIDVKGMLMSWWGLAYNVHTRKGGYMKDYKKTCTLIEYTQAHEQIRKWTLYGCFITEISEDEFNVESDGRRQLNCQIVFDRAVMDTDDREVYVNEGI